MSMHGWKQSPMCVSEHVQLSMSDPDPASVRAEEKSITKMRAVSMFHQNRLSDGQVAAEPT